MTPYSFYLTNPSQIMFIYIQLIIEFFIAFIDSSYIFIFPFDKWTITHTCAVFSLQFCFYHLPCPLPIPLLHLHRHTTDRCVNCKKCHSYIGPFSLAARLSFFLWAHFALSSFSVISYFICGKTCSSANPRVKKSLFQVHVSMSRFQQLLSYLFSPSPTEEL